MAIYTAYFDTAGTEIEDGVLVTVGVVATTKKWDRFDKIWLGILEKYGVSSFHMHDVAHWKGAFASWNRDEERRRAFLADLIKATARGVNKIFIRGLVLADYRMADEKYELTETVGGPYSLAQASCLTTVLDWLHEKKDPNSGFTPFIEKGDTGQGALKKFLRDRLNITTEVVFASRIQPETGEDVTPFSAADLIAYEHRLLYNRANSNQQMPPREKWRGALRAMRAILPVSAGIIESAFLARFCTRLELPPRVP